jgi:hypothetical protein
MEGYVIHIVEGDSLIGSMRYVILEAGTLRFFNVTTNEMMYEYPLTRHKTLVDSMPLLDKTKSVYIPHCFQIRLEPYDRTRLYKRQALSLIAPTAALQQAWCRSLRSWQRSVFPSALAQSTYLQFAQLQQLIKHYGIKNPHTRSRSLFLKPTMVLALLARLRHAT